MDKETFDKLKREDILPFLDKYYDELGREPCERPNYKDYSLLELKKCLVLFGIHLTREGKNPAYKNVNSSEAK
jgi:hypothetical protein